jgi:hypothetical protein
MKVLKENHVEVRAMGFEVRNLGTHSIRKGASSYLTSLPGGPPAAASSIRGGWSMGNVKDRYFKYVEAGDQYVGRCIALNPVLDVALASSPPFFDVISGSEDDHWVTEQSLCQFPAFRLVVGFGKLIRMCLASLLFHRKWIVDTLVVNHVVRLASVTLRNESVLTKIDTLKFLRVTYPWNDNEHVFGGIPPHVALLQQLMLLRSDQMNLINTFTDRVKEALASYGVNSDRLTEDRLRTVLKDFQEELAVHMDRFDQASSRMGNSNSDIDRVETGNGYRLHFYLGRYHRVPIDWRFPRCGVQDLWRMWWIGDTVRQIPPLRFLETIDVNHLDKVNLDDTETHGRALPFRKKRRPASKMMCDLRFLMKFVNDLVEREDAIEDMITLTTVDKMYSLVSKNFDAGERDLQKQWLTAVREIRKAKSAK